MPPSSLSPSPRRRPRHPARAAVTAVLAAALFAAPVLTAPSSLAGPTDPGRDVTSLRAEAARLRTRLDAQHRRLEVVAEELEEAYANGVELLAGASSLDARRRAAERELEAVQAVLDERARSAYIAGPGWFVSGLVGAADPADALARLPLQRAVLEADLALVDRVERAKARLDGTRSRLSARLVDQARRAEQLDARRAEAERLSADLKRELRTMDRRVARHHRPAAAPRGGRPAGRLRRLPGRGQGRRHGPGPRRARLPGGPHGGRGRHGPDRLALRVGGRGPERVRLLGLTSFAYAAAGVTIPRVSRAKFAAYAGLRPVDPLHLVAGDLVFFADNPRARAASTTSACTWAGA